MKRVVALKILRDFGLLAVCAILLAMGHCTTRVIPPIAPVRPTVVYVCDYGIHSSLLLPLGDGRCVEYLYGDWKWAVQGRKGTLNGLRAIFFSDQAALGRRYLTPATGAAFPMPPEQPRITAVVVNGDGVRAVIGQLDARFDREKAFTFQQSMADGGYLYVRDKVHYYVLHDCNSNTTDGLRKMGCTTVGLPVWSDFTVEKARSW